MYLKKVTLLTAVCAALNATTAFAQNITLDKNIREALEQVQPDQIRADITYLADDKLKGRMPGTEGFQMAVDYVTDRLKSTGVKPAGENGTWLQKLNLRRAFTNDALLSFNTGQGSNVPLPGAGSYIVYPNPAVASVKQSSSLVFAGYGISEPGLGYDDYKDIDVKGKTVVIMRGSPEKFSSSVAAHVMNVRMLLKVAAAHGAVGVIIGNADANVKTITGPANGVYSVTDNKGNVIVSQSYYSGQISFLASVTHELLNSFFKTSEKTLEPVIEKLKAGVPQSFVIPQGVNVSFTTTWKDIVSYNVIGKISGADPVLRNEYVVHSAHLDHLGIAKPVEGDSLYNGAHDNASGVASLLGIANIYSHIKVKPRRSILIVMVTGEEMGDLGSEYFALHPTVPVKSMVADVNTDMPTIIAPLLSVTALGAEHSSLNKQVDQAAACLGLTVEPDPEPKQARFTRSDQYSFVLAGIPALHIKYGSKTPDGRNNLTELVAKWRAKYYHKPQDDINGLFDFEAGKKYAQLNFLIGYFVAQDLTRPVWNKGDIFSTR
ncbi:M28 family peptidase [Pedobacter hartonius]|uniref:PA domain-containing protein n=1 Tax=Pedobacter hartonius TaxID=425514 RepID=A0A1H4HJJ8_9SPHI|nr:M28 family peptidase [Pedobacter hartonius]SEB22014.1 PA domain-containing protein [Pedobacter hartonius]